MSDLFKALGIGTAVLFLLGAIWLGYVKIFGPAHEDVRREQFERSKSHRDAIVQDLTDRCAELATATDPQARRAITVVIAQRAATEDLDALQIAAPVRACVENALNQHTGGNPTP